MKYLCMGLIRLYRRFLSPLKPSCCRFTPTCSAYALEAFEKRGFFIGLFLTVYRLMRCNPLCRAGYDPVPLKGIRPFSRTQEEDETNSITEDNT